MYLAFGDHKTYQYILYNPSYNRKYGSDLFWTMF